MTAEERVAKMLPLCSCSGFGVRIYKDDEGMIRCFECGEPPVVLVNDPTAMEIVWTIQAAENDALERAAQICEASCVFGIGQVTLNIRAMKTEVTP